jgi:hypothetical protein
MADVVAGLPNVTFHALLQYLLTSQAFIGCNRRKHLEGWPKYMLGCEPEGSGNPIVGET